MNEKNVNECLHCGCYDEDFGCTMSSMDKWYACPLEANEEEVKEIFNMSEELIRKSEVLKLLYDMQDCGIGEQLCKGAYEAVENMPPVKAAELPCEIRYGEWVYGEFDIPHCSECGTEVMPNYISPFCPNCGAKMEE